MVFLTVTEDEEGTGVQQIPVEDILYMQFDNRNSIAVHTLNSQYVAVGSLRFWEAAFEKAGLNFKRLDRGVLTNLDKVKMVDPVYKIAYFGDGGKKCTMSSTGFKEFSKTNMQMGSSWQTSPFRDAFQK